MPESLPECSAAKPDSANHFATQLSTLEDTGLRVASEPHFGEQVTIGGRI